MSRTRSPPTRRASTPTFNAVGMPANRRGRADRVTIVTVSGRGVRARVWHAVSVGLDAFGYHILGDGRGDTVDLCSVVDRALEGCQRVVGEPERRFGDRAELIQFLGAETHIDGVDVVV